MLRAIDAGAIRATLGQIAATQIGSAKVAAVQVQFLSRQTAQIEIAHATVARSTPGFLFSSETLVRLSRRSW
jgi:hypothetical protein